MPSLFDKLLALLFTAIGIWSIVSFIQDFNSSADTNYFLLLVTFAAFWFAYWNIKSDKKTDDSEDQVVSNKSTNPSLPALNIVKSMWKDDAEIAQKINNAIELAENENWQEIESILCEAEAEIEDWEPYDTSDGHYEMIWKSQISRTREYIEFKSAQ